METILIQIENPEDSKLVQSFLDEHHIKRHVLNDEDKEDIVLGRLMEETDYNDTIDTNDFLNKLRK